jgi:CRP/FNR family transcriptional regulator, cyclic AMP receptor protein
MLDQKIELLEALAIFKGLSKRQLAYILDVTVKVYFEHGDNIVSRNYRGDTAYLILTGAARCLDFPGNPNACQRIEAGSLVGELAMLVDTVHSLTVQARTRIRALAFRRHALKWVMEHDPAIAQHISDNLLIRLQSFAGDLRRLDDFLACIEGAAPVVYGIHALLEPPRAAALPDLAQLPPARKSLPSRW